MSIIASPTVDVYFGAPANSAMPNLADFIFRRGTTLYAALVRQPQTPNGVDTFPFTPCIYSSPDGINWTALNPTQTLIHAVGDVGPMYDCSFGATRHPDTFAELTCLYDEIAHFDLTNGWQFTVYIGHFNFATQTWTAKTALLVTPNYPSMPGRAAGYGTMPNGYAAFLWPDYLTSGRVALGIFNGAGWNFTDVGPGSGAAALLCSNDGTLHAWLSATHYHLSAAGAVLTSENTGVWPSGTVRELADGSIVYPGVDTATFTKLQLATGVYSATPGPHYTWTVQDVSSDQYGTAMSAVWVHEQASTIAGCCFEADNQTTLSDIRSEAAAVGPIAADREAVYWIDSADFAIWRAYGPTYASPTKIVDRVAANDRIAGLAAINYVIAPAPPPSTPTGAVPIAAQNLPMVALPPLPSRCR